MEQDPGQFEGNIDLHATSISLLDRARMQDEEAWRILTELYGPLIYYWCRRSKLSAEDSADILQDVFRSVFTNIEGFERTDKGGTFRGWLWCITRNKIRDHLKTQSGKARAVGGTDAQIHLLTLPDDEPEEGPDSTMSANGGLMSRALNLVRGEIEETTWLAFWRSTIDEVSPACVAVELTISIDSVYQAKSRVLRRLRDLLQ